MKPLLVNSKQVKALIQMDIRTAQREDRFPKPVILRSNRKLWKYSDIKKWVERAMTY